MIAKITHGRSAARALAYDHGPGRADEHVNPRKVAGNIPDRDWRIRAHRMQRFVDAHQHDKTDRGVYRVALANPESDRVLSDREWRQVAEKFVDRFGASKGMWEATRHDRHHIHLTISKDGFEGTRMSTSHDYRRVAAICRELETEHGLTNAAGRAGRGSGRTRGDREQTQRGAPQPDRDWLRTTISGVLDEGGGIEELRAAGVAVKLNQASTGRVSGISYSRTPEPGQDRGNDRGAAEPIWFKGSQLGKAYGWNQVSDQLRDAGHEHGEPAADHASAQRGQRDEAEQRAGSRDGRDDHGGDADAAHRGADEGATPPQPGTGAGGSHGGSGGTLPEPPVLELSLEPKPPSLEQRRAQALAAAHERAAERARAQARDRDQDRGR
ncbi:hypothetical protein C0J29_32500 (plasmid) [Mycobacterium paragordonae]|uniref:MobA/VirD2-like nuclease domain-containing protein n=1 Tax=Mycobacterium paragordonae TaxID=1389713 RepID=A0ABQ1CGK9_9MYCO|nr:MULTISPECIES: hypothetical protein [Mycobacterium]AYE99684.1 hypothetical protein C0J29_32500 [Mycobacterium paragordonae]BDE17438.1 hypothetical protein MKCMC460_62980 [Mycobacterium sp. 20KCMC460]GFG83307.1 hypothetical protein MPRG_65830 [Mycobacterium paragordonae]GLC23049.1 hypothetical protein SRL2020472_56200 [Mycobacterium kiyosense]